VSDYGAKELKVKDIENVVLGVHLELLEEGLDEDAYRDGFIGLEENFEISEKEFSDINILDVLYKAES